VSDQGTAGDVNPELVDPGALAATGRRDDCGDAHKTIPVLPMHRP
jgi:hypothetical protein